MRDLLEDWFKHFPRDGQSGLKQRFRKDDPGQHMGACWELYLHEAHRRLGFEIEYEPQVPERRVGLTSYSNARAASATWWRATMWRVRCTGRRS